MTRLIPNTISAEDSETPQFVRVVASCAGMPFAYSSEFREMVLGQMRAGRPVT